MHNTWQGRDSTTGWAGQGRAGQLSSLPWTPPPGELCTDLADPHSVDLGWVPRWGRRGLRQRQGQHKSGLHVPMVLSRERRYLME